MPDEIPWILRLERQIAEIMGWEDIQVLGGSGPVGLQGKSPDFLPSPATGYRPNLKIPAYADDMTAAFDLVKRFANDDFCLELQKGEWVARFGTKYGYGETAAVAICMAVIELVKPKL